MSNEANQPIPPATREHLRLKEQSEHVPPWRRWGPYVSEREWGTVREDYSGDGNAWTYFTHSAACARAYRWGEDGLGAICDRYQILVFALALWNGRDPLLKERLFGVTPPEGNHGEDVKEYYFYLDSTPTHSYMKFLYKYPQSEFPYRRLIEENQRRGGRGLEYELLDTGIFDEDRYFDVFVEYAKASPEDICIKIEAVNRGPEAAVLHIIPHLWFRNTWAWSDPRDSEPVISAGPAGGDYVSLVADDSGGAGPRTVPFEYKLGERYLYGDAGADLLFTNNETNPAEWVGAETIYDRPYYKDAFHRRIVAGQDATNPEGRGTKSCLHYRREVEAGGSAVIRLRFAPERMKTPLKDIDEVIELRRAEADEFYASIHPRKASEDERRVQRQALAGLLWTKQCYIFDVNVWLDGDRRDHPPPYGHQLVRNIHWRHLNSMRVLSVPDKWEYPWFAAWDLAFHAVALTLVDPEFAKEQLWLMLFEQFQHPNGQIPAYEWEFSDLNPPVHAWACWRVYNLERVRTGTGDRAWLEKCFHKLLINFAWWVNKVDSEGNNIFEGGFLGLDNITVIDRSEKHENGVILEQSDATGWMGMFCLNLMRIALELAKENKVYESLATKFFEHYAYVGAAMKHMGGGDFTLWDERDGFFYDVLRYPDGSFHKFRVRSLVGIIPLYAVERLEINWIEPFRDFRAQPQLVRQEPAGRGAAVDLPERARRHEGLCARDSQRVSDAQDIAESIRPGRVSIRLRSAQPLQAPPGAPIYFRRERSALRAGRDRQQAQGRQLELARPGLVPDLVSDDRIAQEIGQGVRLAVPNKAAERGARGDADGDGRDTGQPADKHIHPERARAQAGVRRHAKIPGRPALARLDTLLRVLPRRQRRGDRVEPSGLERARRHAHRRMAKVIESRIWP